MLLQLCCCLPTSPPQSSMNTDVIWSSVANALLLCGGGKQGLSACCKLGLHHVALFLPPNTHALFKLRCVCCCRRERDQELQSHSVVVTSEGDLSCSHGVTSSPLAGRLVMLLLIALENVGDLRDERVIRVGVSEQRADREEHLGDSESGRPLIF